MLVMGAPLLCSVESKLKCADIFSLPGVDITGCRDWSEIVGQISRWIWPVFGGDAGGE